MTAYELACAGIPFAALVVADNQVRVGAGLRRAGVAPPLDARGGVDEGALEAMLGPLRAPAARAASAAAGRRQIDGRGAACTAAALAERWRAAGV